jgi:hypothetical protein
MIEKALEASNVRAAFARQMGTCQQKSQKTGSVEK